MSHTHTYIIQKNQFFFECVNKINQPNESSNKKTKNKLNYENQYLKLNEKPKNDVLELCKTKNQYKKNYICIIDLFVEKCI